MYETTLELISRQQGKFRTGNGRILYASFLEKGTLLTTDSGNYAIQMWENGFVRQLYHLSPDAAECLINRAYFYNQVYHEEIKPTQAEYEGMIVPYPEMK